MNIPCKRKIMIFILMCLVSLACLFEPITINNALTTENPNETPEVTTTGSMLEALNEQMETRMAVTLSAMETEQVENRTQSALETNEAETLTQSAMETNEAESLIYGVKPEKIICEGDYTTTVTNLDQPSETCSFVVPFTLEFWNVGALGKAAYGEATFYWSYVDFQWESCSVDKMTDTTSTGQFSGGPDGKASVAWASIQLSDGQTGSLTYYDENESAEGTCTIDNPAVFSGWTEP